MHNKFSFSIFVLVWITNVAAAPVESVQARDFATCQDPNAGIDPSCWDLLDLTTYVTNWNKTTPICPPGPTTGKCCGATEAWTTCFLRMNQPQSGSDCTELSSCSFSPTLAQIPNDVHMTAQVHYIMFNIYALNFFFSSWYTAMAYATTQAQTAVDGIIQEIDPKKKASGKLNDILTGLTLGLAFLGGPEAAVVGKVTATAASVLVTGLQNAPGTIKALWPQDTTDSQLWQMASLSDSLGTLDKQIRGRINAALHEVMTDVPTFLAFAVHGQFSNPSPPSIDKETGGLDQALKTYLVSKALDANAMYGFMAHHYPNEECPVSYNCMGECITEPARTNWHSNNSNADYKILPQGGTADTRPQNDLLHNLLQKNYTTGRQLFDGAATCNGMWNTQLEAWNELEAFHYNPPPEGKALFAVSAQGIDFSCVSQWTIFHGADQ